MSSLGIKGFFMTSPIIMGILLLGSVVMVAYALERIIFYSTYGKFPKVLWKKITNLVHEGRIQDAASLCVGDKSLYAKIFLSGLEKAHLSRTDVEDSMFVQKEEAQEQFRMHLGVFGTMSFISPLMGLLGTVIGIYRAFHDLALTGSGGPAIVAAGVSAALLTTIAGISVAVPAAVIYNYFTFRLRGIIVTMNSYSQLLVMLIFERSKRL